MKSLFFIRHGESKANIDNIYGGTNLIQLSNKGINDTLALSKKIKIVNISRIISSDSTRAIQTSEILNNKLNCKIEEWKELKEIDCGEYKNDKKEKGVNIIEKAFDSKTGENFYDVINRATIVINKLRLIKDDENILIVGHNAFTSVIFFILKNNIINVNNLLNYKKKWKFRNLEIKEIYL